MKTLQAKLIVLAIFSLLLIIPATSMAVEETQGVLNSRVDVQYDGSGFVFLLNVNSPCGEIGFFVPKTNANYSEIYSAVMDARRNTETVLVVTSGCWGINPQFSVVYGISVGR